MNAEQRRIENQAFEDEYRSVGKDLDETGPQAVEARISFLRRKLNDWEKRCTDIDEIISTIQESVQWAQETLRKDDLSRVEDTRVIGFFDKFHIMGEAEIPYIDGIQESNEPKRLILESGLGRALDFLKALKEDHKPQAQTTKKLLRFKLTVARDVLWQRVVHGQRRPKVEPPDKTIECVKAAVPLMDKFENGDDLITPGRFLDYLADHGGITVRGGGTAKRSYYQEHLISGLGLTNTDYDWRDLRNRIEETSRVHEHS